MSNLKFKIGDRVQFKPSIFGDYKQPWRDRVKRGLFGVIERIHGDVYWPYTVRLDMPKQVKNIHDWYWTSVREDQLIPVTTDADKRQEGGAE